MNKIQKAVFVISSLAIGGAEGVLASVAGYFDAAGIDVSILLVSNSACDYRLPNSVSVIPVCEAANGKPRICAPLTRIGAVRRVLRHLQPDVVISFLASVNLYVCAASAGLDVPLIVSERNDPAHDPANPLKRGLRALLYPLADGYVFQTPRVRDFFSKAVRGRSEVIANPLKSDLPARWNGKRRCCIAAAGRLEVQKNYPLLLNAFAEFHHAFPMYSLEIYGEGALRQSLEALCERLGLARHVRFMEKCPQWQHHIRDAAMFVLSSDYEGMSNALMEAMAVGIPCVASDCPSGGSGALIENGKNGLLFHTGDAEGLLHAMKRLARDAVLSERLGEAAAMSVKRYNTPEICERWLDYANKVAGKKQMRHKR